jgi:DNA-binding response OmpR family regulator
MVQQIMLIEEDDPLRMALKRAFEESEFQVKDVSNPFEALEKLNDDIDLTLCDLTYSHYHSMTNEILACEAGHSVGDMQYRNGVWLLKSARELGYQTKFLFICDRVSMTDRSVARIYGSTVHIAKPFAVADLVSFVDDWLSMESQKALAER